MRMPDPVIVGFPERGGPRVLGFVRGHLLTDPLIGTSLRFQTLAGEAIFRVNVAYVPDNPKREKLILILEPMSPLPSDLWDSQGFERVEGEPPPALVQEEWPF